MSEQSEVLTCTKCQKRVDFCACRGKRKKIMKIEKTGPGFAGFAQVSLQSRLDLLRATLEAALDLGEQGKLTSAEIARLREIGRRA